MTRKTALGVVFGCVCVLAQAGAFAQAVGPFEAKTDAELTELAAQWESLDQDDRRALLTEMRSRMERTGERPVLTIKSQRRYGRILRDAEGNQVRIQTTHVVRLKRVAPRGMQQPFGVGFEHRQVASDSAADPESAPLREPLRGPLREPSLPPNNAKAPLPVIHVGRPAETP